MSKYLVLVLSLAVFSSVAIAASGALLAREPSLEADYESATIWGDTDLGDVQSSIDGYLSSSLIEPWSGREVRVVVLSHAFERNGRVLGRSFLHRIFDDSSADEAITATMSFNPDPGSPSTGPLPTYSIEIAPKPGETWKSISTYEQLVVTGSRTN